MQSYKTKITSFVCAVLENNGVWNLVANKSNEVHLPLQNYYAMKVIHEIADFSRIDAKMNL